MLGLPTLVGGTRCSRPEPVGDGESGKFVRRGMAVGKRHDDQALAFVIVPDALGIVPAPVHVPNPIPLDDFVGRAASYFRGFEGYSIVAAARINDVAGNTSRPDVINRPFHQVTVAILRIAVRAFVVADVRFEKDVALVRRTTKYLR